MHATNTELILEKLHELQYTNAFPWTHCNYL